MLLTQSTQFIMLAQIQATKGKENNGIYVMFININIAFSINENVITEYK